jgi:hypothetical protein
MQACGHVAHLNSEAIILDSEAKHDGACGLGEITLMVHVDLTAPFGRASRDSSELDSPLVAAL